MKGNKYKNPNDVRDYHIAIRKLFDENYETFVKKNKEYGNAFQDSVRKYGMVAALTRMGDKFSRIETMILNNNDAEFESLQDSLLDLANYCIMSAYESELKEKYDKDSINTKYDTGDSDAK